MNLSLEALSFYAASNLVNLNLLARSHKRTRAHACMHAQVFNPYSNL